MTNYDRSLRASVLALPLLAASPHSGKVLVAERPHVEPAFVTASYANDRFVPVAIRRIRSGYAIAKASAKAVARRAVSGSTSTPYTTAVNLSTTIGADFAPYALNNDGRVVGSSFYVAGQPFPYDEPSGVLINYSGSFGVFPISSPPGGEYQSIFVGEFPISVTNKSGAIAGYATTSFYYAPTGPDVYNGWGTWTVSGATGVSTNYVDTGYFAQGYPGPTIEAMGNQNVPVGGNAFFGFAKDMVTEFPIRTCPLSNFSAASITDAGLIGGRSDNVAAVLTLGTCPSLVPNVGPGPSAVEVVANDGDMLIAEGPSYVVWSKGAVSQPIPLPSGYSATTYRIDALALNDNGVVVGDIEQISNGTPVAAFRYLSGQSTDLTTLFPASSGWIALSAVGINDHNEIIGQGTFNGHASQAYALR